MCLKNYIILSVLFFIGCDSGTNSSEKDPIAPDGMKFISSNGASFEMGQIGVQVPVHTVSFSYDYFMDSTEVTQVDYERVMSNSVFGYKAYKNPGWDSIKGIGSFLPAYNVNWYDAVLYSNAKSKKYGLDTVYRYDTIIYHESTNNCDTLPGLVIDYSKRGYRLPTEAEWEFACRAGTTTDNYWGDDNIGNYAWYYSNSGSKPHEVAKKIPNKFGLYDMCGNLYEWCNDWHNTYTAESQLNPIGPDTWGQFEYRVIRGRFYNSYSHEFKSASRNGSSAYMDESINGFRTVLNREIPQSW